MQLMKPTFTVKHRHGTNRHGRQVTLRHASLPGFLAVDRKSKAWCYKEKANEAGGLVKVVASPDWGDHMDAFRPDYVPITFDWVKKIQLRMRAFA